MDASTQAESYHKSAFQGAPIGHRQTARTASWVEIHADSVPDASELKSQISQPYYGEQYHEPEVMLSEHQYAEHEMPGTRKKPSLADATTAYERRLRRTTETRFEDSALRMEAHYLLSNIQQAVKHFQESADRIVTKASEIKRPKKGSSKLRARMQADLEVIEKRMQVADKVLTDLRERDRRTAKAEEGLDNAVRAMVAAAQRDYLGRDDDAGSDVFLASTSPSQSEDLVTAGPPIAPQLANFYDAVSDFKIMRERVGDLYIERQEQWERRLLLEDQDQVLDQSDDQFLATWVDILEGPEKDLRRAHLALRDARNACVEAEIAMPSSEELEVSGIETDEMAIAAPADGTVSPPNSIPHHQLHESLHAPFQRSELLRLGIEERHQVSSAPTGPILPSHGTSPAAPVAGSPPTDARVYQWIENLETNPDNLPDDRPSNTLSNETVRTPVLPLPTAHEKHSLRTVQSLELLKTPIFSNDSHTGRERASSFPRSAVEGRQKRIRPMDQVPPNLQRPP